MNYVCKICNQQIENNSHFYNLHKIKISEYFHKFEPRRTKSDQQVIFKNDIENYFEIEFNDLNERAAWLKSAPPDEQKEYLLNLLIKRKIKKNWVFAPGQSQLRLANIPSILFFEKTFNLPFQEICKKLDFKIKFKNDLKIIQKVNYSDKLNIKIDTREKNQLKFPEHITVAMGKLDYGDISLLENEKIAIERKSLNDLTNTLSGGYERFRRELGRAKKNRGYLIILCESNFNDFKSIEYLPQTKHSKCTFEFVAKRARDLYEEFDNIQMCFCNGRRNAAKVSEFILKINKKVKNVDLQYLIDTKII